MLCRLRLQRSTSTTTIISAAYFIKKKSLMMDGEANDRQYNRTYHKKTQYGARKHSERDSAAQQSDRPQIKRPPGLKGKEIGLWHARRSRVKKEHQGRIQVGMNEQSVKDIENLLGNAVDDGACSSTDNKQCTRQSTKVEPSNYSTPIDDEFNEFSYEYMENIHLNDLRSVKQESIPERMECQLRNSPELNKALKDEFLHHVSNGRLQTFRKKLPSYKMRQEIIREINRNQVLVISGETGCGKTTQVPQFILDDYISEGYGSLCNIVCTQPRRISAVTVAERVAEERDELLGRSVGYSIRLDSRPARTHASITYCTTGVLLRRMRTDMHLSDLSHIVVDEVHERDIQTDFLLILLKDLLIRRPDIRLVLMSATLNADQFSQYFHNAPMLHIPGFTYPVEEYFLEDIMDITRYVPDPFDQRKTPKRSPSQPERVNEIDDPGKLQQYITMECSEKLSAPGMDSLLMMDFKKVHYKLVAATVEYICHTKPDGAILVFLPGWADISEVKKLLTAHLKRLPNLIIPLHSLMPTTEQKTVFERPPSGVRKIVLATNIAETSITIDDIVYVVDSGKIKITDFDTNRNMSTLASTWVSKANAKQRRGRAGRVQPGICYYMYTRYHSNILEDYQRPEMLRTRLENVCLDVKLLGQGRIEPFLMKAMNPPSQEAVEQSIGFLKSLNALDENEVLTPLGFHLARLPLDPQTGKMVLMSSIFSCIDPVLTIAACLSFRDPFHVPMGREKEVDYAKRRLSAGTYSDHLVSYYAVKGWENAHNKSQYCYTNFISHNTVNLIAKMKKQFAELLYKHKLISSPNPKDALANKNSENVPLIRSMLCAGLYPQVAKVRRLGRTRVALSTETERKIDLHPKCVNNGLPLFELGQWVVYYELVKLASKPCLMDCSLMPAFPIMLFGGKLDKEVKGGDVVAEYQAITVDKWISFECDWKYADLIQRLRQQFDEVLEERISNPRPTNPDASSREGATLKAIIDLINQEKI